MDNDYTKSWDDNQKIKTFFTLWEEQNNIVEVVVDDTL